MCSYPRCANETQSSCLGVKGRHFLQTRSWGGRPSACGKEGVCETAARRWMANKRELEMGMNVISTPQSIIKSLLGEEGIS